MKTSSKLTILLLSALLIMSVATGLPLVSAMSSDELQARPQELSGVSAGLAPSVKETVNIGPLGASGSGWKPDIVVAGEPNNDTVNPSMGTYIDPITGAVTLYVVCQYWDVPGHWIIHIYRSNDRGNTWYWWFWAAWTSPNTRSIYNPSIAISPFNGTVFVAWQDGPVGAPWNLSNDISLFRVNPTTNAWNWWAIDADADDDRSPQLVSEYGWGTANYLYVSYEMYWTYDDRDLHVRRSTDWGQTWSDILYLGMTDATVYTQSAIADVQWNLYIAYRHSTDYSTPGHIEVMYSTNYGLSFLGPYEVSGTTKIDAWDPSIAGSRVGPTHNPTTLWVAFRNASGAPTYGDIFVSWSKDYGNTWSSPGVIAATSNNEMKPKLSVDGMGTESMNVPGRFHLVYWTSESTATRTDGIYYTQIADYEPSYFPAPSVYYFWEGWSTPQGQIIDNNGFASAAYNTPTITTFTRMIGTEKIWVPGVAWTDFRNPTYDIYYTTLDTMFTVSFYPSTQSVVAGGSLSFNVTVTRNSGTTATATLDITGPYTYHAASAGIWGHTFSPPTITPTGSSLLTFNTANYLGPGTYYFNASAVIGGYRRYATIPFTVTAAPTLTLNINPSIVARGSPVTISGQLTPGMATTIYLFYRFPHATGSWALGTTMPTNAAGAFSVSATVPMSVTPGVYDLIAVWFSPANGSYAASPIRVLTIR